ncbi:MAG TPA: single-stranded DNA-binding protein [Candidatus Saccharimonadales bacterium]|nr:single-stranded DNA-binding protein [Candidatus Saccharimonadales bacterium]
MFSLNRAQIIGNLTRDPEVKSLPSGQTVTNFAVATNRRWKDKDGNNQESTQYHEVQVWGKLGELASQMLSKGKKVYVEGRLETSSWDASDGTKRSQTRITAENFIPLSPKGDGAGFDIAAALSGDEDAKPQKTDKKDDSKGTEINLDDIPF